MIALVTADVNNLFAGHEPENPSRIPDPLELYPVQYKDIVPGLGSVISVECLALTPLAETLLERNKHTLQQDKKYLVEEFLFQGAVHHDVRAFPEINSDTSNVMAGTVLLPGKALYTATSLRPIRLEFFRLGMRDSPLNIDANIVELDWRKDTVRAYEIDSTGTRTEFDELRLKELFNCIMNRFSVPQPEEKPPVRRYRKHPGRLDYRYG